MSEPQANPPSPSGTDELEVVHARPILPRGLLFAMALTALALMAYPSLNFLKESMTLQEDLSRTEAKAVIGYPGIHPNISYARPPGPWLQRDGSKIKLWSGWIQGAGHTWFTVNDSEIQPERLAPPLGRDSLPAIDYPITETAGGIIWDRIPDRAEVAGQRLAMVDTAYPLLVLDKVVVVNDTIAGQPFLITYNRFETREKGVVIFDPVLKGTRLTFGHTGYLQAKVPIFYDRGTESLWTVRGGFLVSISGRYKGEMLKPIARPLPISWSEWRYGHPKSRLIIGSDRAKSRPSL